MKSYTDLGQSKKLAEILPLESADGFWEYHDKWYSECDEWEGYEDYPRAEPYLKYTRKENEWKEDKSDVPCWSLAALLQILPLGIYDELDNCDYELEIDMIDKMPRYIRLGDIYHSKFPYDFEKDTLLDNIVESIIWLNNNNYFEL